MLRWREGSWEELCKNGENEECFAAIIMDFPAHSWEKMLLCCCDIMDCNEIQTQTSQILCPDSPRLKQGFHWGVAGVAEPSVEGLLNLKVPVAMVMAPFAKYFWFLCHVMNVLGCGLLSSLSA